MLLWHRWILSTLSPSFSRNFYIVPSKLGKNYLSDGDNLRNCFPTQNYICIYCNTLQILDKGISWTFCVKYLSCFWRFPPHHMKTGCTLIFLLQNTITLVLFGFHSLQYNSINSNSFYITASFSASILTKIYKLSEQMFSTFSKPFYCISI